MALSLKNKLVLFSFLCVFFLLVNCSEKQPETSEKKTTTEECKKDTVSLNPNGDSELALLMRNMLHSTESLKEMIKGGNVPDKFPEEFLKIHTAKPTDSETKKTSFEGFAENYLTSLKNLHNSQKNNVQDNYNLVINACVSCHQEHCPGPLRVINKLKIN